MKSFSFSLLFLLISTVISAQDSFFSGKILYDYKFENPNTGEDITKILSTQLGKEQHYYIDGKSYKSYNEKGEFSQLYNSSTNTYYFVQPQTGSLMQLDASNSMDSVISINKLSDTEMILGMESKKLIVISQNSETVYWYNESIKVDPNIFKNHEFGEWASYLAATNGALPLKYTVKTQYYNWTSTAISIEEMKFTEDDFNIEAILDSLED